MLEPRSFGLTFDPPSITLVYVTSGKTRKRTMPVRGLTADTEAAAAAAALQSSHATLLAPDIVSTEQRLLALAATARVFRSRQLQRLIEKLIKHKQQRRQKRLVQGQQPLAERGGSSRRREGDTTPSSSVGLDRSRRSPAKPDGGGSGSAPVGARGSHNLAEKAVEKPVARANESQGGGGAASPADPSLDLNKVSEEELKKHKEAMAEVFEANRLRPGDPGYVHDKRVEFEGEKEDNEWDDEISDFESEVDEFEELLKGL